LHNISGTYTNRRILFSVFYVLPSGVTNDDDDDDDNSVTSSLGAFRVCIIRHRYDARNIPSPWSSTTLSELMS